MTTNLHLTQDEAADELLSRDPFALLVGMLLDQQVPMEHAFAGPATLAQRLGSFDAVTIAGMDRDSFVEVCATRPAIHRYPASMGKRVHALAVHVRDELGGDAARVWTDATDGADLRRRLQALPGYGPQKAQILVALLGKQLGVRPRGWRAAAGGYGGAGVFRSIADVVDTASLGKVRAYKQQQKRAAREARPAAP